MSSFPTPVVRRRSGAGGLLIVVFFLLMAGYFVYNMAPNLVGKLIPGGTSGVGGEWVGLVTVENSMMENKKHVAAVKFTLSPTDVTSIIPTYKMVGEISEEGQPAPVQFSSSKVYTGHSIVDLSGTMEDASDPRMKGGFIGGGLKGKTLTFEVNGMSGASLKGDLLKGTDSDYNGLVAKLGK